MGRSATSEALLDRLRPAVRALVLLPTRDLAMQATRAELGGRLGKMGFNND